MKVLYLLSAVVFFSFYSCRTETIQCDAAGVKVCFVGFTFSEMNIVTVFTYKKDNLFDSLVDSVAMHVYHNSTSDTLTVPNTFDDNHDYQVKLQGSNTVYSITGLTLGNNYTEKYQTGMVNDLVLRKCVNNTVSYTLNGQQFGQPNVMSGVYNVVYINK